MNKNNKKNEVHLFIIWEKARLLESKILNDINEKFLVLDIYKSAWDKHLFSENLSRFYGEKLPNRSFKERHCGKGDFLVIIVEDTNPRYEYRDTSKDSALVNINIFEAKLLYRSWTGGGHKIHATNDISESRHDLALLLGLEAKTYLNGKYIAKPNSERKLLGNLVGANTWNSITELFYVLNQTTNYVVLRNFECLPDQYTMKNHGDIDLLVEDLKAISYITNAQKIFKAKSRVLNNISIKNENILFDFRYLGDNYFDYLWQKDILKNRELSISGYYRPNQKDYFYSLLYHALIHKKFISSDYEKKIINLSKNIVPVPLEKDSFSPSREAEKTLAKFLSEKGYNYTLPLDLSVYFNRSNRYLTKAIRIYNFFIFNLKQLPIYTLSIKKIYRFSKETILINLSRVGF